MAQEMGISTLMEEMDDEGLAALKLVFRSAVSGMRLRYDRCSF